MITDDGCTVQEAQLLIYRAKLQILEDQVLTALAGYPGRARAPLWQPSPVIQIVSFDGVHVGRVRRDHAPSGDCRWFDMPPRPGRPSGPYATDRAAAHALAVQQPTGTRRLAP